MYMYCPTLHLSPASFATFAPVVGAVLLCMMLLLLLCVQAFSRFYFVGDEDLLEIVGNANEPAKVAQHLGKMFASVGAISMPPG